jgi:hypothetical protein
VPDIEVIKTSVPALLMVESSAAVQAFFPEHPLYRRLGAYRDAGDRPYKGLSRQKWEAV